MVTPEEFNPFAWMTGDGPPRPQPESALAGRIGPEGALGVEPPATANMLNGGMECSYSGVRMRPGDIVTSVSSLSEYTERVGRLGLMLFTVTEQRWTNQEGQELKIQRDVLIRY
jgi:hypothetical protein